MQLITFLHINFLFVASQIKVLNSLTLVLVCQICVVQSADRDPLINEFNVSGTTYAPEGTVFDSNGQQVITSSPMAYVSYQLLYMTLVKMTGSCFTYMLTRTA